MKMTVKEDIFIEYPIKNVCNSFLYLELSHKRNIQLFVSTKHLYPTEAEHKWAFGDYNKEFIKSLSENPYMRDLFTEATPFQIDGTQITYSRHFKNHERFKPKSSTVEVNPDIVKELTTFKEEEDEKENDGSYQQKDVGEDHGIKVLLETECWRFISEVAHFGIYNISGQEMEISFRLEEVPEENIMPYDLRDKNEIFEKIFEGTDASGTS